MSQFEIRKSGRKCHADQQELAPGTTFYSVLVESEDGTTERRDYCQQHWEDPGSECIGWWKAQVPEREQGRIFWAPRKVMLAYFEHVLNQNDADDLAYVTALVLVQKKILTVEGEGHAPNQLQLKNRLEKTEYVVDVCDIAPERMAQIQSELGERLFMDEPIEEDDDVDGEDLSEVHDEPS